MQQVPRIEIRKAVCEDIHQLEKLFLEVRQSGFTWENPDKFKIEDFKKATDGEIIFVAENEYNKIIGFISVWTHDSPAFIHHLFVATSHQRQGIGRLLIQSISFHIPLPYRLKCLSRNEQALAFYISSGWTIIGNGTSQDGDYFVLELY